MKQHSAQAVMAFPVKYYAGIGSRKTSPRLQRLLREYAKLLRARGYILRSGGARGADSFFESGAGSDKEIYLHTEEYNGKRGIVVGDDPRLRTIAERFHPAWHALTPIVKQLHTRNVAQIIGPDPDSPRSAFVLCWTPGARWVGGTSQALRIARHYHVPIYNLAGPNTFEQDILCMPGIDVGIPLDEIG